MIRPVDTTLLDAVAKTAPDKPAPNPPPADAAGKNAFAAQLKRESQKAAETSAPAAAKTSPEKAGDARNRTAHRMSPPEDEQWKPVKGRDDYAEIISGPRKGQYVNLTRGERRGEAFTIEKRDGKTVHVYKREGQPDLVVSLTKEERAAGARGRHREPPKGETWAPVAGKPNYADILSGKRNGYYINTHQGSCREGMIFHIVRRGGRQYHVYGEGNDKLWVPVKPDKPKKSQAAEGAPPAAGAGGSRGASGSTGGSGAASGSRTGGVSAPSGDDD